MDTNGYLSASIAKHLMAKQLMTAYGIPAPLASQNTPSATQPTLPLSAPYNSHDALADFLTIPEHAFTHALVMEPHTDDFFLMTGYPRPGAVDAHHLCSNDTLSCCARAHAVWV